ncbi:MAG: hypothetical protein VX230_03640, partial [Candidatus Thermoplasmatota archaeon]|nr:hypothetical protein [Candidatus Thermoplasmatota archaeon]
MAAAASRARYVSAIGGMNMVAEAEPNQIRLVCVGGDEDSAPPHIRKWMETRPLEGIEVAVQFDEDLTSALEILEEGGADLLA